MENNTPDLLLEETSSTDLMESVDRSAVVNPFQEPVAENAKTAKELGVVRPSAEVEAAVEAIEAAAVEYPTFSTTEPTDIFFFAPSFPGMEDRIPTREGRYGRENNRRGAFGEREERGGRYDRNERSDRGDRNERNDRGNRGERNDRFDDNGMARWIAHARKVSD